MFSGFIYFIFDFSVFLLGFPRFWWKNFLGFLGGSFSMRSIAVLPKKVKVQLALSREAQHVLPKRKKARPVLQRATGSTVRASWKGKSTVCFHGKKKKSTACVMLPREAQFCLCKLQKKWKTQLCFWASVFFFRFYVFSGFHDFWLSVFFGFCFYFFFLVFSWKRIVCRKLLTWDLVQRFRHDKSNGETVRNLDAPFKR